MEIQLPYKAEYAKTGRAGCKGCKTNIPQGQLRLAAMVQSAFHDGKQPNWFHEDCFFKKQRPSSEGDIENFQNMRFEDQERLQKKIAGLEPIPEGKGGKKRGKSDNPGVKDFSIEYAKSGRAVCRGCELKILKDQVRISKTVFDTEVGMKYGGQALWHHVECFVQLRSELSWFDSGELLPGFKSLNDDDKANVKKTLPAMKKENESVAKKAKLEPKDEVDKADDEKLAKKLKEQSTRLFAFRDKISTSMSKNHIVELLQNNKQDAVTGDSEKLLDQVADLVTFGALAPCSECKGKQLLFHKSGYLCTGNLTEWTKCANLTKEPKRTACKVSSALKKEYGFLKDVKKTTETRAIRYLVPSASTIAKNVPLKKDDELEGPKVKREQPPLYNFRFSYCGLNEKDLKKRLMKLGGICETKINEKTMAVFANSKEMERMGSRIKKAKLFGIQILPLEYLDAVEANGACAISSISSMSLCDWGTDPTARAPQEDTHKSAKSRSIYTKSVPSSVKLKVKDGLAVDPDSGLEDVAHVYVEGANKYNVVLGLTDIQRNKNSYYKLQLLESESKNRFWVFRSWGRIGTTIGNTKLDHFSTVYDAILSFLEIYADKTGNEFGNRHQFVKMPGRLYPIDVDYSEDIKEDLSAEQTVESKLDPAVQSLVKLLFDIESMKRTMMEFDLDMEKMPLGKLSQKQIQSAYKVLTEVAELIQKKGTNSSFIDVTNRFYTLIPHNFGVQAPPLLDTTKQVENLRQMLDSLMEIECAYNLMKTEQPNSKEDINPIDKHYEQLKTKLEPLDKGADEFSLLEQYVKNTHAETHKMFDLEVVDIFKVNRQGEQRRFKPFKKLHNRKLLWHGSRLTNFAGILSHGLKIAPPEAPATGYMFGKGIYFADMVSKSANYCCTSSQNSTGLMLLSEVALGDMMECTAANYVTTLPKNKHSCFGRGRTMPDPKKSCIREDGVEIPLGMPKTDEKLKSSLLYNEYIVYDIAQVNIQYLLRLDFKYKY